MGRREKVAYTHNKYKSEIVRDQNMCFTKVRNHLRDMAYDDSIEKVFILSKSFL